MKRKLILLMLVLTSCILAGCSKDSKTEEDYKRLMGEFDTLKTEFDNLKSKNDELIKENNELKSKMDSFALDTESDDTKQGKNTKVSNKNMTGKELEAALLEQPMYVISSEYVVQDEEYKALYPDMLNAVIKNNSGEDVKNATVAFVAWDKNNFPVKIVGHIDFTGGSYVKECNFGDVNMIDGSTYGEDKGMAISYADCGNIETIKAIVVDYKNFDEKTWENPYYETWVGLYENKKLEE